MVVEHYDDRRFLAGDPLKLVVFLVDETDFSNTWFDGYIIKIITADTMYLTAVSKMPHAID